MRRDVDFLAADFRRAGDLRAAVFVRPVLLRADDFFAAVFLRAVVFLRPVLLRADDFFAAGFRRAVVFFRAVDFFAVRRFLVAAAFLPAVDRLAAVRFLVAAAFFAAVDRFLAGDLRADVFLRAAVFLAAAICCPLSLLAAGLPGPPALSSRVSREDPSGVSCASGVQDAMRFRRRRSRSLMPPQTP